MAETPAERQERLRRFAEDHNKRVEDKQNEGRDNKSDQKSRENLDQKDSES